MATRTVFRGGPRSGASRQGGLARRKRVWARSGAQQVGITNSAPSRARPLVDFRTAAFGDPLVGGPIGVTIGGARLSLMTFATAIVDATSRLHVGLRVSAEDNLGEIDGPSTNPHDDWLFFSTLHVRTINTEVYLNGGQDYVIRSMRKMEEVGEDLVLVAQATTGTFTMSWSLSVLLLLP